MVRDERISSLLLWKELLSYFKIRKTERFGPPVDENGNVGKNAGDGLHFGIVVTLRGLMDVTVSTNSRCNANCKANLGSWKKST